MRGGRSCSEAAENLCVFTWIEDAEAKSTVAGGIVNPLFLCRVNFDSAKMRYAHQLLMEIFLTKPKVNGLTRVGRLSHTKWSTPLPERLGAGWIPGWIQGFQLLWLCRPFLSQVCQLCTLLAKFKDSTLLKVSTLRKWKCDLPCLLLYTHKHYSDENLLSYGIWVGDNNQHNYATIYALRE